MSFFVIFKDDLFVTLLLFKEKSNDNNKEKEEKNQYFFELLNDLKQGMTAWTHVSLDIANSTLWKRTLIRSFERTKIFIKNYVVVLTEVDRMHQKKSEGVSVGHCKVKKQNQVPYL